MNARARPLHGGATITRAAPTEVALKLSSRRDAAGDLVVRILAPAGVRAITLAGVTRPEPGAKVFHTGRPDRGGRRGAAVRGGDAPVHAVRSWGQSVPGEWDGYALVDEALRLLGR